LKSLGLARKKGKSVKYLKDKVESAIKGNDVKEEKWYLRTYLHK